MGLGFQRIEPGQSFAEHVDMMIAQLLGQLRAQGFGPEQVDLTMNVSRRSDAEVELARERAAAAGLTHLVLVDDHQPPRPGTVPSASLDPVQSATMAEARAARVLGER